VHIYLVIRALQHRGVDESDDCGGGAVPGGRGGILRYNTILEFSRRIFFFFSSYTPL
jgi:hypothetical protein